MPYPHGQDARNLAAAAKIHAERMKAQTQPTNDWLDELLVTQRNLVEQGFHSRIVADEKLKEAIRDHINQAVTEGRIAENDYHWHHQKHITKRAINGTVSAYFLKRQDELRGEE